MNAKEQIIRLLKREIAYFKASDLDTTELYNLIATIEAAIFDVPNYNQICHASKEYAGIKQETEIDSEERYFNANIPFYDAFMEGCNFILNYKKTEADGKANLD